MSSRFLCQILDTHLMHSVLRHERQERGQVGKLESLEWKLQETVETDVVVVPVAA